MYISDILNIKIKPSSLSTFVLSNAKRTVSWFRDSGVYRNELNSKQSG